MKNEPHSQQLTIQQAISRAKKAAKQGNTAVAVNLYNAILQHQPNHPIAKKALRKLQKGLPQNQSAQAETTQPSQVQIDVLVNLYQAGQMAKVKLACDKLLKSYPQSLEVINILGSANHAQGKLEEAVAAYNKALSIKPDYAEAHYNMGNALRDHGKLDEAIAAYNKALLIRPGLAEAHNNMGLVFQALGKLEKAIAAYNKAILIKPDYAEAHNNMGLVFQALGKLEEAIAAYNKALSIKPDYAEAHNNMGLVFQALGKLEKAIAAYNKALSIKPDYAEAHNNMGLVFQALGNLEKAIAAYNKALLIKPGLAEAHNNMGNALREHGQLEEAIAAYNKAILIKPDYAQAHNNMGNTQRNQGKLEEAIAAYNKAILIKPDYAEAHRHLSALKKYAHPDPQIVQMEKLYADANISIESRCRLCFALAKCSEDLRNFEEAFRYLKEGNALRKKILNYDIVQDEEIFSRIKGTANSFKDFSLDASGDKNISTPILILGMPRSGTTLVEQIISNHSKVTAADELSFLKMLGAPLAVGKTEVTSETLKKVKNQYLDELMKLSAGRPFVTDKMPNNFFYIGLICSALPEAKIVHVRRNSAATCWSNYKQYFAGEGLGYSYDLLDVVHYYQMYQELMRFWDKHYPGKIYHLNYERLTTDQEHETKKLIQYLGVDWEDACLFPEKNKRYVKTSSSVQVREKVYKNSSEEWKKFEKYLDRAFDELPN